MKIGTMDRKDELECDFDNRGIHVAQRRKT